ncbi:AAA family ATPase [Micromonospora echinospora]|uniref:AAA family ATPase n=1 Tax=Micromonospora echinospora TaxID=1877 RepID=UPI003A83F15B
MSMIKAVSVTGLAGRKEPINISLNPDINIFFGENGTGKTGLLKILHSALDMQAAPLVGVAFEHATVEVATDSEHADTRTFTRPEEFDLLLRELSGRNFAGSISELLRSREMTWDVTSIKSPPAQSPSAKRLAAQYATTLRRRATGSRTLGRFVVSHGYLPITRLTTDLSAPSRYHYAERLEELDLDDVFSNALQDRWKTYTNRVLSEVRAAQEDALAQVLEVVVTPFNTTEEADANEIDTEQAYQRVSSFLGRQRSIRRVNLDINFGHEYKNDPKLRRVVNLIDQVEERIEEIMKTRSALQDLVTRLMGRNKRVQFTDEAIFVELLSQQQISLSRLSSGEKQLLRILVESTMAGPHVMIIDEPELSMHIDWQRKLLSAMRTVNPESQIIVATHSPEIMADYEDEKIFSL